ncbi:MAG TPA: hypothetical protein VKA36_03445 [Solirubrobacterales bacterium]|nr:hypothetical protein [Solirubrobacterales bacterium]
MAGRSLRAQLNQIRAWVREGRTDAWIAHQLEVPAAELRDFRRRHGLAPDDEADGDDDLRDEIEAEVEAATLEDDDSDDEEEDEDEDSDDDSDDEDDRDDRDDRDGSRSGEGGGRRRRRRRGGRGRGRKRKLEATFDHGKDDGYGLWLDASVKDDPVYSEHWAGHRKVEVSVEADQIVIRRSDD